jgi:CubicO group peptidase (beta-lactamase class C family)
MRIRKVYLCKCTFGFKKTSIRRINVLGIMLLTSISLLGFTTAQPVNLDSGLVAFYPFNGNADNAAGSTGHGTIVGSVIFGEDRFGNSNSAAYFSPSVESYIVFNEDEVDLPMGNSPRSFSMWIKSPRVEAVVSLFDYGGLEYSEICEMQIVHDRPRLFFGYYGFYVVGQSIITDTNWHHIVAVYDGSLATLYVDSKWDNEAIIGETIMQANTTSFEDGIWTIGINKTLEWSTFEGCIDDIRIYNRVLSEDEVIALYDFHTRPVENKIYQGNVALSSSREEDFQNIIDDEVATNNVLGLSTAIISDDWQWQGASGLSSSGSPEGLSTEIQMTPNKLFRLGRAMDSYISALILELAEEGELSLDDSLYQWLPSYPNVDSTITVKQLLNNSSGISGFMWHDDLGEQFWGNPSRIFTPEEILLNYVEEPCFAPGERNSVSETNYLLLGLIIKEIIQSEISTELRNRYLDTLNLNNTYFAIEESLPGNIAHEHQEVDSWRFFDYTSYAKSSNAINSSLWTSGAMYSTSMDFAKWIHSLLGGNVISQDALNQMLTFEPYPFEGFGICRDLRFKREFCEIGGPVRVGYRTHFLYSPEDRFCIAVLNNYFPADMDLIMGKLLYATLVHQDQLPSPRFEPMEMDLGTVVSGFPVIDTSFTVYNEGVATDHITLYVDFSNLDSSALTVEPMAFDLAAGSSQQVSILIDPSSMNDTTYYRPKIIIHSDNDLILPAALTERIYFSNNMPSGITDEKPNRLPDKYILYQNYPNPFYASTRISFELPGRTKVKLVVYDLSGRQVRLLTNSLFRAGKHSVVWNGHNDEGKAMASGLYFIHLQAADHVLTRKIMMLK